MMVLGMAVLSMVWAELKIGYINSEKIFAEYQGTKDAQAKFNKEVAKWEQEATERQKEIKESKEQLEKQSLLLSDERKKEIEDKLRQKMVEYQEFLQNKFGQKGEALEKNEELTKPILDKINKIIEKIAQEDKYDYIFDARTSGIVFAKQSYDLTERVVAILNKEK
jgi:outer membrane protein